MKGIVHYHHFYHDGRLLEDKYFWVYRIENTKGKLKVKVLEGENIWMTEEQYKGLPNTFATYEELVEVINNEKLIYIDRVKYIDNY